MGLLSKFSCSHTSLLNILHYYSLGYPRIPSITPRLWPIMEGYDIGFLNPTNAKATFVQRKRTQRLKKKHLNHVMLVLNEKLAEYCQMSTLLPRFQSFFRCFASFCIGQISHLTLQMLRLLSSKAQGHKDLKTSNPVMLVSIE